MTPAGAKADEARADLFATEVRRELRRVVESAAFCGSHRCTGFLEFVVTKALHGDAESLKERTLAIELFGRKAAADLAEDSIVRVGAREVRKRLAQYYVEEGAGDTIRIELPSGSYAPVFHQVEPRQPAGSGAVVDAPPAVEPQRANPTGFRSRKLLVTMVVLAATIGALAAWRWMSRPPSDFEVFWQPAFSQSTPMIVAMAHPLVYHPSFRAQILTDQKDGPNELPFQRPVERELLTGSDFVPVVDQYTGFGDAVAAVHLGVLFAQHSRSLRVRSASKLDFNDFRDSATILVGSFTNRWTAELTRDFRYRFRYTATGQPCIIDATTGKSRWMVEKKDNGESKEDYILICRVPHSQTGHLIVILAGLTQYGTQEAGRILSEPDALTSILRQLPSKWPRQNLELVLHSQVVGDAPTPPELAGWHVW
jgi:hypothetical protein